MRGNHILLKYIDDLLHAAEVQEIDSSEFDEEERELAEALNQLGKDLLEVKQFSSKLAEGSLEVLGSHENPLLGPLKSLQASLRHLTWQVIQIEKGDYGQHVDFMGDFSRAFNSMIEQLKQREIHAREKAELEKHIARQREWLLTQQLEQQIHYYRNMSEFNQQLRMFQHDANNHFLCLDSYLSRGDVEGARAYLGKIATVISVRDSLVETGNPVFDALLSDKINAAREKDIRVETQITVGRELHITAFDWCVLFGNALDNAIEACERIDNGIKKITVRVKHVGNILNVMIRNTIAEKPVKEGEFYKTSKQDQIQHGMGLPGIAEAVNRYEGVLQMQVQEDEFVLTFLLCGV